MSGDVWTFSTPVEIAAAADEILRRGMDGRLAGAEVNSLMSALRTKLELLVSVARASRILAQLRAIGIEVNLEDGSIVEDESVRWKAANAELRRWQACNVWLTRLAYADLLATAGDAEGAVRERAAFARGWPAYAEHFEQEHGRRPPHPDDKTVSDRITRRDVVEQIGRRLEEVAKKHGIPLVGAEEPDVELPSAPTSASVRLTDDEQAALDVEN